MSGSTIAGSLVKRARGFVVALKLDMTHYWQPTAEGISGGSRKD
jgi:hypothetical protein